MLAKVTDVVRPYIAIQGEIININIETLPVHVQRQLQDTLRKPTSSRARRQKIKRELMNLDKPMGLPPPPARSSGYGMPPPSF